MAHELKSTPHSARTNNDLAATLKGSRQANTRQELPILSDQSTANKHFLYIMLVRA